MGLLGTPKGIFKLNDSDKYVGSFISRSDLKDIFSIKDNDLNKIEFEIIDGEEYIDETSLRNYWAKDKIPNSPPYKIGNSRISLDEYILVSIIKKTFPNSIVEQQVKWGRKYIDIKVINGDYSFFIEFHGPGHFIQLSRRTPEDPFQRKFQIENEFGLKCFIWPYWIQRCSKNLKILIGELNENGYGALWSTKMHFGEFYFHNSADIIKEITRQFNAAPNDNFGYFYEEFNDSRIKPEHPIVKSILNNRLKNGIDILLPNGLEGEEIENWLPAKIKKKVLAHSKNNSETVG